MNRIATWVAVAALVCSAGAALGSQETDADRLEVVAKGEIVAVSAEERTITLEETAEWSSDPLQPGVRRTFAINEATKMTAGDERIELATITVGAQATIRYMMDDGKNIALAVETGRPATE